jgi:acyl-coA dehydrogenase
MSRSTFVRALSAIGVAAALSVGAAMPAAHADFHAYDHVGLKGELVRSGFSNFIDVPDNMLSSAANWTGGHLRGLTLTGGETMLPSTLTQDRCFTMLVIPPTTLLIM